jgi:integrase
MANKSKKGDGSYKKRANGTFELTISIGNDTYGKRQRMSFYGKTEDECRKKYRKWLKEGEKPQTKNKERTLSAWFDEYLPAYKEQKVEGSTYADYIHLASHVKKHAIGNMKLSQIKPLHITGYFTDKIDYSHSFRKRSKFLLNAAFECAIDNDYCIKNPVKRAEIANKPQTEKEAYTEDETRIILDFAKTDELFGVPMYILLNTGVRAGEMRAMQVNSIDLESEVVTIDKAVKRTGELGLPKNNKIRYIPLEPEATEFLKSKLIGSGYIIGGDEYVTHSGFRGRYEWFFDRLNRHLESKGEKPIEMKSPHSTRHTFGTLRQKNGMPITMVARLLGHSSTEMTEKYTHLGDVATLSEAVRKYPFLNPMAV